MGFLLMLMLPLIQGVGSACCSLDVSAPANSSELKVVVTNLGKTPVQVLLMAPESNLRIQLRAQDGSSPPLTDYAKRRSGSGSRFTEILNHQETTAQFLDLRKLFIIRPGTYAVTVSRDVFVGERKIELQGKTTIRVP